MNYPASRNDFMDAQRDQDNRAGKPFQKLTHPVHRWEWADDTSFTRDEREWIALGVNSMNALGPTNIWVTDGTGTRRPRHWRDDNSTNPTTDTTQNAGRSTLLADGTWDVEFDPQGIHGRRAWIDAAAHEAGHTMGILTHVPREDGPAIMNPTIAELKLGGLPTGPDPTVGNDMEGEQTPNAPTWLDFKLWDETVGP